MPEKKTHKKLALKVLFLAAEAEPLIKVGGLGDVAGALPRALHYFASKPNSGIKELDIRLMIPFHQEIQHKKTPFFYLSTHPQNDYRHLQQLKFFV